MQRKMKDNDMCEGSYMPTSAPVKTQTDCPVCGRRMYVLASGKLRNHSPRMKRSVEPVDRAKLDELHKYAFLTRKKEEEADALRRRRNRLIVELHSTGVPVKEITSASQLGAPAVYFALKRPTVDMEEEWA